MFRYSIMKSVGVSTQKKLREYFIGLVPKYITVKVLREEGFRTKQEYWNALNDEYKRLKYEEQKQSQKAKYQNERSKKIQAVKKIQNAFRKYQVAKLKPIYTTDIYDNTKVKRYRFKNINNTKFNVRPHDIYEHIAYNNRKIKDALNENTGNGIKATLGVLGWIFKRGEFEAQLKDMDKGAWYDEFIQSGKVNDTVIKILDEISTQHYRKGGYKSVFAGTNTSKFIKQQVESIEKQFEEFINNGSDLLIYKYDYVDVNIAKNNNPVRAGSYIPLPDFIASKKACVNVKNEDNECSKWSIKCLKFHKRFPTNKDRVAKYKKITDDTTDYSMLQYPTPVSGWTSLKRLMMKV